MVPVRLGYVLARAVLSRFSSKIKWLDRKDIYNDGLESSWWVNFNIGTGRLRRRGYPLLKCTLLNYNKSKFISSLATDSAGKKGIFWHSFITNNAGVPRSLAQENHNQVAYIQIQLNNDNPSVFLSASHSCFVAESVQCYKTIILEKLPCVLLAHLQGWVWQ